MKDIFRKFAHKTSEVVGSPIAFITALSLILLWALTGPIFHFSDTWQLVINTATTIITFLMVFLIQNTQNRDAKALHLKLDELIRSIKDARNSLVALEELSDDDLENLQIQFRRISELSNHLSSNVEEAAEVIEEKKQESEKKKKELEDEIHPA